MSALSPFQRHMRFFAKPGTMSITPLSALKSFLSLGLDFPVACVMTIGLQIYSSFPFLAPINIRSLSPRFSRTQIEQARLDKQYYSRADLVKLSPPRDPISTALDRMHIIMFWAMAADTETHLVSADTVKAFQQGDWADDVVKRRRSRRKGEGEVLPLWRGGPISATGHSWFVRKLFGVRVYEP